MENEIKSGIYAIRSEGAKIVYLDVSTNVYMRVKKLESDYRIGRGIKLLSKLGLRFRRDIVFEEVKRCSDNNYNEYLWAISEMFGDQGYEVKGWNVNPVAIDAGNRLAARDEGCLPSGVEDRIKTILGLGMGRRELIEMLDKQIEYMRNKKDHGNVG